MRECVTSWPVANREVANWVSGVLGVASWTVAKCTVPVVAEIVSMPYHVVVQTLQHTDFRQNCALRVGKML